MNKLYRIKPLAWENPTIHLGGVTWYADQYEIQQADKRVFLWNFVGRPVAGQCSTLEAAKAACEEHRRKLLEEELEPVYQTTTELPTEPGYYWFSSTGKSESWWLKVVATSSRDKSKLLVEAGGGEYYESPLRGQWIRIPEPEKINEE